MYMYACMHVYDVHIHACMCVHMCAYMYTYVHFNTRFFSSKCVYVCVHTFQHSKYVQMSGVIQLVRFFDCYLTECAIMGSKEGYLTRLVKKMQFRRFSNIFSFR